MNTIDDANLLRIAMQALRPKTKNRRRRFVGNQLMVGRLALTFPSLDAGYGSKFSRGFYADVETYLETWEVRMLNDVYKRDTSIPLRNSFVISSNATSGATSSPAPGTGCPTGASIICAPSGPTGPFWAGRRPTSVA